MLVTLKEVKENTYVYISVCFISWSVLEKVQYLNNTISIFLFLLHNSHACFHGHKTY